MPDKNPKIAVIIPTLQEEDYIQEILLRLNKVEPALEIVVVDGGSRDRTVELAKPFASKVFQTRKHGIAGGRNYGAKEASGDGLVFLDADVTFPADFAKKVLDIFNNAGVVGATCNIMPLQSQSSAKTFFRLYNTMLRFSAKFKPHARGEFFAVRKSAFNEAEGFDESMPCLEDHDLANRLSRLGRFVFIADLTVYESLRRLRKIGFWRAVFTWFMDYISFMFRGKPISQTWQPVR